HPPTTPENNPDHPKRERASTRHTQVKTRCLQTTHNRANGALCPGMAHQASLAGDLDDHALVLQHLQGAACRPARSVMMLGDGGPRGSGRPWSPARSRLASSSRLAHTAAQSGSLTWAGIPGDGTRWQDQPGPGAPVAVSLRGALVVAAQAGVPG